MWKVKATVIPMVIGTLGAVTSKLGGTALQIPETTSQVFVHKSSVLRTAEIGPSGSQDQNLKEVRSLPAGVWNFIYFICEPSYNMHKIFPDVCTDINFEWQFISGSFEHTAAVLGAHFSVHYQALQCITI